MIRLATKLATLMTYTPRTRENSGSKRCPPRCSEFWLGERRGVILPAAQWHESALLASKEPPIAGGLRSRRPMKAATTLGDTAPVGTNWHGPSLIASNCTDKSEVRPKGFEPLTLGSEDCDSSSFVMKRIDLPRKRCYGMRSTWRPKLIWRIFSMPRR